MSGLNHLQLTLLQKIRQEIVEKLFSFGSKSFNVFSILDFTNLVLSSKSHFEMISPKEEERKRLMKRLSRICSNFEAELTQISKKI